MSVHGDLKLIVDEPEVEQADARDIAGVGQRLESRDGRVARPWVGGESVDHPPDLVAARVRVVVKARRVAVGVTEFRHARMVGEIRMHPRHAFGIAVLGNDRVVHLR